jgi:membrane protease YdiL (CAAX protease family)
MTAGLVLGFAYLLTKSLYFSLGFHFGWNFFLGAIPVVSHISTHNAPEWDNLLTILIVLIIMTSVYFFLKPSLETIHIGYGDKVVGINSIIYHNKTP